MMFKNASVLEQTVWELKLADYPRSLNRAKINDLANGGAPYSFEEEQRNNIEINVSNLSLTRLAHDARGQQNNALLKPGQFFTAQTDMGAAHKRNERGAVFTREINKVMKRSRYYMEYLRSKLALNVLHGIGPGLWYDREMWCPDEVGIDDVLMPGNTRLSMRNLPFFAIAKSWTAMELERMTRGPNRNPGWQMPVVDAALKWADQETLTMKSTLWNDTWNPEKFRERIKENGGYYGSDRVPTIDVFDCYFYEDGTNPGWRRRVIFDGYGGSGSWASYAENKTTPEKNLLGKRGDFLFNSGRVKYADHLSELVSFQFADLSAVAPFHYHAVRSLGWLMYAVCHLQNRLHCKFQEAVFETLMMYMRVKSLDDAERAIKIQLASRGIIDESVSFLRPDERWNPNVQLAELGIRQNDQIINENASSYTQDKNYSRDSVEKTKFQVGAELNASMTLISAALTQTYWYQKFEYQEIARRFCRKDSRDPDVREFRLNCLKQGIPEKMLTAQAWSLEPEKVMGGGNKTLELAAVNQLMQFRNLYPPESQTTILRDFTLAVTDNPGRAMLLVPDNADHISDAAHDAMVAMGTLMLGLPVKFTSAQNRIEICETLLAEMAMVIKRIEGRGGMATEPEIIGLQNVGTTIAEQIQFISQDKNERERAKKYAQELGAMMNMVKAYAQRLQQQQEAAQQNGNGDFDPKDKAKVAAMVIAARAKADNSRESHGQKTAQRQIQFEQKQEQQKQSHMLDMRKKMVETEVDVAATDLRTAAEIERAKENPPETTTE